MIDHISLGSLHFEEAIKFYSAVFAPLGYRLEHHTQEEAAFGPPGKWVFWLYPVEASGGIVGKRCHVAVTATNKDDIVRFHELAKQKGAATVREPGGRPDISPDYFGAIIRDLDGHTIEVVHWTM
ncbi:MAG TPA: VOC family protein [Candidatus Sulfotelmatobacter sp.]|nr:VOC family protein [Candidatus Sulfotelmatobacter sp.]